MRRSRPAALVVLGLALAFRPACAGRSEPAGSALGVTVEDFSYLDTSGEPVDQVGQHQARLSAFMGALRRDVGADGHDRLVAPSCTPPCTEEAGAPAQHAAQGEESIRIIGAIHKMSTLIQLAKVTVIEIGTNRVLFDRGYTFRGDNDEAWNRAEAFVAQDVSGVLAAYRPPQ